MNINNRIATLDLIFQELLDTHPTPLWIESKKYKLSHDQQMHIEAMLSQTGLVDVIDKDYSATQFRLNSKGLIQLKDKSYSAYLMAKEEKEKKTDRQKRVSEWPQRNWLLIAIVTFIVTSIAAPLAVEMLKHTLLPTPTEGQLKYEETDSPNKDTKPGKKNSTIATDTTKK